MNCRETMPPINTDAKKGKGMHGHYEQMSLLQHIIWTNTMKRQHQAAA